MAKTLKDHMYKRAGMSLGKKNGGEDPPKKGSAPLPNTFKAPSSNLMAKTEYVPVAKALGSDFSKDKHYNRTNAKIRNKVDVPAEGKTREYYKKVKEAEDRVNAEMKVKREDFANQFKAGKLTRNQLRDSLTTTHEPGIKNRQIRKQLIAIAGRKPIGETVSEIKNKTKEIAKATGKKIKKVCTPVQKGKAGSGVNLCKINRVGDAF